MKDETRFDLRVVAFGLAVALSFALIARGSWWGLGWAFVALVNWPRRDR